MNPQDYLRSRYFFIFIVLVLLGSSLPTRVIGQVKTLEPQQLAGFIKRHPGTQLVDVREDWERKKVKLPDSIPLPLGDISSAINLLKIDKPVITYCKSGRRANHAAEVLDKMGFKEVYTLKGGLDAYTHEIDPALPLS